MHDEQPLASSAPELNERPSGGAEPLVSAPWHALSPEQARSRLYSGGEGLSSSEAERRLEQYGPNALPEGARRDLLVVVFQQLKSPLIYLLLAAAAVSLALGELKDAMFIALVLAINTAIGSVQEARAEANTAALRSAIRTSTRVLRDGVVRRVDSAELVPGDIVQIEAGERVPADLRLLHSAELQADEASLTGESLPVNKSALAVLPGDTLLADRLNMLYAGSSVQTGRGEALVVATGRATELGRIAQTLSQPAAAPPLMTRLERFSKNLGFVSLLLVGAVVGLRLLAGAGLRETFLLAIALAVSVIPEGLPVAVTVALSLATRRMARRNVIVRQLPAVEGLGACTVIATDKTGTLTVNQLTARRVWLPDQGQISVTGEGYAPAGELFLESGPASEAARQSLATLCASAALCNDASFNPERGVAGASGDSVDLAFLVLAAKAGLDFAVLRDRAPRVAEIPFAAERKYAASLNWTDSRYILHVKGAAEVIIPLCEGQDSGEAIRIADGMAAAGYRVLAVAEKIIENTVSEGWENLEGSVVRLRLLGLVGFIDPLRPEAKEAVANCHRAGVAVKMITGDHALTALSIARELGIARSQSDVVTGRDIRSKEAPERIVNANVFARVEPTQKVEIVDSLRAAGHVVAMTGDGVNDAPALRRADLGVAMGKGGTDVARNAADLVLTDDNFASIVSGIEEGRAAYANIRKVIYLLISTGAAEVVLFFLALASGLPLPLTAIQLLWLNLVTNGGQDVALAFEKREPGLLDRPPRRPKEAIFDALMIRQTLVSGIYMGAVGYSVFYWLLAHGWNEFEARNLLLFLMVLFENVHVFNCRSETRSALQIPFSNNWPLIMAVASAQALHIAAAFIPGLRDVLQVEPISLMTWFILVPSAVSLLIVMEAHKYLRVRTR